MLEIQNIHFRYGRRQILDKINGTLSPGQAMILKGDNGTGKTTLIKLIAGLLPLQGGHISLNDHPVGSESYQRSMEYLSSEGNGLFASLSIRENLKFWTSLKGHRWDQKSFGSLLKDWQLDHPILQTSSFKVGSMSTGMKRRLALMRVSLAPSQLWLLDEPLSGLDAKSVQKFAEVANAHLANQGMIILVSHDVGVFDLLKAKVKILDLASAGRVYANH